MFKKYSPFFIPMIILNLLVLFLGPGCFDSSPSIGCHENTNTLANCNDQIAEDEKAMDDKFSAINLTLTVSADKSTFTRVGEIINYTFTVTNNPGTTALNNFSVSDDKVKVSCPYTGIRQTTSCTGSYTVTEADMELGKIEDHATVKTTTNSLLQCDYVTGAGSQTLYKNLTYVKTATASHTISGASILPAMNLTMSVDPNTHDGLGKTVTFQYTIKNIGNIVLYPSFSIDNSLFNSIDCGSGESLQPGESINCSATYTIDAGIRWDVTNHARVVAKYYKGLVWSNNASATVTFSSPAVTPNPEPILD
ncbi:MAG: hypothetical protein GYA52_05230 [Chloroflexi bacterium]|jgi:hypothetical protein|nr:hypothetical protein [Chloroflexota bacterium]